MPLQDKTVRLCNCNKTVALDARRLADALKLDAPPTIHHALCRQEVAAFRGALEPAAQVVVSCTQEAPLFRELAEQARFDGGLQFVNIRENAGWSEEGADAGAKIAALLASSGVPEPEPVPAVAYRSEGALLIVGPAAPAIAWAEQLKNRLDVSVLVSEPGGELPELREYPLFSGTNIKISGFLGEFKVDWEQSNPIDLELCTRCNACVSACPEHAIDFGYQVDLDRCRAHRACVAACDAIGAIDFERSARTRGERFDLVLDLSREPLIRLPHPPQGYFAPGRDVLAQAKAAQELVALVGEFEKPKFFAYKESLCAHGRNEIVGCNACIDVCSTGAIAHDGNRVKVEPHLCLGCGGCATVCPSGAMRHVYPRVSELGARVKAMLSAYRAAGGRDACILFHDERSEPVVTRIGRRAAAGGRGLPARVIPFSVHRTSAIGLDLLLGTIAYGASQCVILSHADEAEGYLDATGRQMEYGEVILNALGFSGRHLHEIEATEPEAVERALWALAPAATVSRPAGFNLSDEKRSTLEFVFDHFTKNAPTPQQEIALIAGAPWGRVELDKAKCTLCMSCVGACPASALMDAPDFPRLKFVERNCVQCGLCVETCPEDALSLSPRLLLTDEARRERVLNEAEPFACVRCGKPFSTRQMVDGMSARLASHSMFRDAQALRRLQMCADCRVADMMENKNEMTVHDL